MRPILPIKVRVHKPVNPNIVSGITWIPAMDAVDGHICNLTAVRTSGNSNYGHLTGLAGFEGYAFALDWLEELDPPNGVMLFDDTPDDSVASWIGRQGDPVNLHCTVEEDDPIELFRAAWRK